MRPAIVPAEEDGTTAQLATRFSVEGFVSAWAGAMGLITARSEEISDTTNRMDRRVRTDMAGSTFRRGWIVSAIGSRGAPPDASG